VACHSADHPNNDQVRIELRRDCKCDCGHRHEVVEMISMHPRNVSRGAR
jgi:hypothetical protein